jgi:hypothetical protein
LPHDTPLALVVHAPVPSHTWPTAAFSEGSQLLVPHEVPAL